MRVLGRAYPAMLYTPSRRRYVPSCPDARESTKKPRVEASQTPTTEVQALQDRVAQLTAENEYLRGQVAELQARLGV